MKPTTNNLIYTGGDVYIGLGSTNEGHWYIADYDNDSVRILNANPTEVGDDMWNVEWQEEHLIKDYEDGSKDAILFLYQSLSLYADRCAKNSDVYRLMEYLEKNYASFLGKKVRVISLSIYDDSDGLGELIEETEDSITLRWIHASPCYSCCHICADAYRKNTVVPKKDICGDVTYSEMYEYFVEEMRQESIKVAEYKDEFFFGVNEKIPHLLKELNLKDDDNIPAEYIKADDGKHSMEIDIPFRGEVRKISIKHHYNKDCSEIAASFGVQIAKNAYRDWLFENKDDWKNYKFSEL